MLYSAVKLQGKYRNNSLTLTLNTIPLFKYQTREKSWNLNSGESTLCFGMYKPCLKNQGYGEKVDSSH